MRILCFQMARELGLACLQAPAQVKQRAPATPSNGNTGSSMYQSIDLDAEEICWVMTPAPGALQPHNQCITWSKPCNVHQRYQGDKQLPRDLGTCCWVVSYQRSHRG